MKSVDFYLGEEKGDKHTMFLDWCKNEGIVMPKLEFPAYFENGLVGVRCKEDILNREAFLFVPYKTMFTVSKIKNHPVLGPMITKNPKCFGNHDLPIKNDVVILAFGILYEMSLGQKSYWYPYLRQMLNT